MMMKQIQLVKPWPAVGLETEADIQDRKAVPKLYPTCARLAARDGILLGGKLIREGKRSRGGGHGSPNEDGEKTFLWVKRMACTCPYKLQGDRPHASP